MTDKLARSTLGRMWITRVVIAALALVLSGCAGVAIDLPAPAATPGVVVVEPDLGAVAPAVVSVEKAQVWKQGKNDPKPEKGNAYIAVLVKIEATEDADYSPYYTKVRDKEGFEYDWLIVPAKQPGLGAGELAPGASVKGWVTFEVPKSALTGLTFVYDSLFGEQVVIPLKVAT